MRPNSKQPEGYCQECNNYFAHLQLDHIIPLFLGGANATWNFQWLCKSCHRAKTTREILTNPSHFSYKHLDDVRWKWTPEQRQRMSEIKSGQRHSQETRDKMRQAQKQRRKHEQETGTGAYSESFAEKMRSHANDPAMNQKLRDGANKRWHG